MPLHEEPLHRADRERSVDVATAARPLAGRRAHVRAHRGDRVRLARQDVPLLEPPFGGEVEVAPAVRADGAGFLALDVALEPGGIHGLDEEFLGRVDGHEVDVPFLRVRGRATGTTAQRGAVVRNLSSRGCTCTPSGGAVARRDGPIVLTHAGGAATLGATHGPDFLTLGAGKEVREPVRDRLPGPRHRPRRGHRCGNRRGGPIPTGTPARGPGHDLAELRGPASELDARGDGGGWGRPADARLARGRGLVRGPRGLLHRRHATGSLARRRGGLRPNARSIGSGDHPVERRRRPRRPGQRDDARPARRGAGAVGLHDGGLVHGWSVAGRSVVGRPVPAIVAAVDTATRSRRGVGPRPHAAGRRLRSSTRSMTRLPRPASGPGSRPRSLRS